MKYGKDNYYQQGLKTIYVQQIPIIVADSLYDPCIFTRQDSFQDMVELSFN